MRYLILFLILQSCTCDYHLSRAIAKCGSIKRVDTLTVRDTITINSVQLDTVVKASVGDTVYLEKERLKVKFVRLKGDSFFISGKCDTVKIDRIIKVPCTTVDIIEPPFYKKLGFWLVIFFAVVIAYLLRSLRK